MASFGNSNIKKFQTEKNKSDIHNDEYKSEKPNEDLLRQKYKAHYITGALNSNFKNNKIVNL